MKKPFHDFIVGDKTLRLKMTTLAIIGVESQVGENLITFIDKNPIPSIGQIVMTFREAAKEYKPDVTMKEVIDMVEEYSEDHDITDLVKEYNEVMQTSGFFCKKEKKNE